MASSEAGQNIFIQWEQSTGFRPRDATQLPEKTI